MKYLVLAIMLALCACHNEERGAWKIVKQRGHENYGFYTEMGEGFILAGFTNKADAIAAMERHRERHRNPPPRAEQSKNGIWEEVPNSSFHRLNLGGKVADYPVQWNSNLPPLQSLMIGDSQVFTNIVFSNDYSGTIQIGTNFATTKELDTLMQVLGEMKRGDESLIKVANTHPNVTYTVDVANGLWKHTNVVEIHKCSEFCTRMRYVDDGLTNDFHAAFVGYTVITNAP